MTISSSLYSSISGLSTLGSAMSVLGDNVANVNTIAFKSSRATFQDVLAQSVSTAAGSAQVGRGVTLSTVDGIFAQGSFESSTNPTDMAIGGQGFFMLRAADSAEAAMYTRAGEFRFDQEGYLISPMGYFVQGWSINSDSGERQGTIGDIYLGKSTPPVATQRIQAIVNLDSREPKEANETRLFNAWNGTNVAAVTPTDPIDSANYDYTSAIKIYDSQGASHDITVYFDRTSNDNEWEFLVTCDPSEDLRVLTGGDLVTYAPNETYNYHEHKGAGALMYGIVNFNTSGDITRISAWNVPPDGKVDPALNTNRVILDSTDKYYSFEANFTGDTVNQSIELNLGARYSGLPTNQTQVLVSNKGAFDSLALSSYITKETLWNSVFDSAGNGMADGDVFTFAGYQNDGTYVTGRYVVRGTDKVQKLLDAVGTTFGGTAAVDDKGRLRVTDGKGGDSGMYVTSFAVSSASGADPFGGGSTITNNWARTTTGATTNGTNVIADPAALLTTIGNAALQTVTANDTFTFSGNAINGTDVTLAGNNVFTVGVTGNSIQDLLNFAARLYEDGSSATASSTPPRVITRLDTNGNLRIADSTNSGQFAAISCVFADVDASGFDNPWGGVGGGNILSVQDSISGQVNITTSKREVVSPGRALSSNTGQPPVITEATSWSTIFQSSSPYTQIANGDQIVFSGKKGDGTTVDPITYSVNTTNNSTIRDLLDEIETAFDVDAFIDGAGRLIVRDRLSDSATRTSELTFKIDSYTGATIFGTANTNFETIQADLTEDGSRQGDVVSTSFDTEALSSTQYANASTTIYQDQNGYASGFLQSVSVDTDGVITGHFSNGQVLKKAQVALATFNNTAGLKKEGGNLFTQTTQSGGPITGAPGTNGLGSIAPNALEQSNVDLGNEFVKLITTQRGFQANSKIITTTDEMLADLISIKR